MGVRGARMRICVRGVWHLGAVPAACLASVGHEVVGLDFDQATIDALSKGVPPLQEPGLQPLLEAGLAAGNLRFTTNIEAAVGNIDVLWVSYDTPVDDDDNAAVAFVLAQIEQALPSLAPGVMVLVSS